MKLPRAMALICALAWPSWVVAHGAAAHSGAGAPDVSPAAIEFMVGVQVARGRAPDEALREEVAQALQRRAVMAREARRAGLASDPRVKAELEVATQQILAQAWEARLRRELAPTEAQVRERWESLRRQANGADAQAGFESMKGRIAEALLQERVHQRLNNLTSATAPARPAVTR